MEFRTFGGPWITQPWKALGFPWRPFLTLYRISQVFLAHAPNPNTEFTPLKSWLAAYRTKNSNHQYNSLYSNHHIYKSLNLKYRWRYLPLTMSNSFFFLIGGILRKSVPSCFSWSGRRIDKWTTLKKLLAFLFHARGGTGNNPLWQHGKAELRSEIGAPSGVTCLLVLVIILLRNRDKDFGYHFR